MTRKRILTGTLLCFVAAAILFSIVREVRSSGGSTSAETTPDQTTSPLIVYYFYTTIRCESCKTIEAYTREAVEQGFPKELKMGALAWRMVNVDEPANRHFIADHELTSKSVVLVQQHQGKPGRWRTLERIWTLIDDKKGFLDYVRHEVAVMLADQG